AAAVVVVEFQGVLVGEVAAPFGLEGVGEHRRAVALLLICLQLDLGLVRLEVLSAHWSLPVTTSLRGDPPADGEVGHIAYADNTVRSAHFVRVARLRTGRSGPCSDPLLLDLRGLSDPIAEVVELGPADVTPGRDLDL